MSLDRKDLRLKLDHEIHAALDVLADVDGRPMADLAEEILSEVVRRRIHAANMISERAKRLGIAGSGRE